MDAEQGEKKRQKNGYAKLEAIITDLTAKKGPVE